MSGCPKSTRADATPSRVAVDLTPLLPGGENGGAKLLTIETVRGLSRLRPEDQFLLLTSERSHDELGCLDAPNVRRLCVRQHSTTTVPPDVSSRNKIRLQILSRARIASFLSPSLRSLIKRYLFPSSVRQHLRIAPSVTKEFGADLLFCPFTMPFYHDPTIPTVSIVYDLQYLHYPRFFDEEDRWARARNFGEACRLSSRVVCISEFVRKTVLENSDLPPERVVTIPIRLAGRLSKPKAETRQAALASFRLSENGFFFYPANFWAHKNHRMLLTAYGMYRARNPRSPFKLVCTGSAVDRMSTLTEAVLQMGLGAWVCLPGFLTEMDFAALFASCYALVFPSLYEGFGMPVLEAMTMGKPVLCSDVTSLPEVAGNAALYFSPKKPEELVSAMERITEDRDLVRQLVARGIDHSASYMKAESMASDYLAVFREALG
jgi:glycosyltransferase involved in cell wall biosynthesis